MEDQKASKGVVRVLKDSGHGIRMICLNRTPIAIGVSCLRVSLIILIAMLLVFHVDVGDTLAQGMPRTKIRIATPGPSMSYFPIYVALQRGLYRKHGIEPEVIQMSSGPTSVAALLNREIDYSTALGPAATMATRGAPLKIICFTSVKLQHSLFTRPEIRTPKDLSGKTIGVGPLRGLTWYEVQFVIRKYGLQNVKIIAAGQNQRSLAALQAGGLDAAIISVPSDIKAEEMGLRRLIRMGEILPIPQVGLATTEEKIKKHSEEVLRVLKATIEGLTYVRSRSNRQDVVDITAKWINLTPGQAEKAFSSVEDTFSTNCIPTSEQSAAYLPMLQVTTDSKETISPDAVFSFSLAESAAKEMMVNR